MLCSWCKTLVGANEIRIGVCWNCATVESIINEGVDMDDAGLQDHTGDSKPAKTAKEKVLLLIQKGLVSYT